MYSKEKPAKGSKGSVQFKTTKRGCDQNLMLQFCESESISINF
jgi:hypothetical protein